MAFRRSDAPRANVIGIGDTDEEIDKLVGRASPADTGKLGHAIGVRLLCASICCATLVGYLVGTSLTSSQLTHKPSQLTHKPRTCPLPPRPPMAATRRSESDTIFESWLSGTFRAASPEWQQWCVQRLAGDDKEKWRGGDRLRPGSQFHQDVMIFRNFFQEKAMRGERGLYIDSGANDWAVLSNTLLFDKCLGWEGICLEPDQRYAPGLKANRSCHYFPECISEHETTTSFTMSGTGGHVGGGAGASQVRCRPLSAFLKAVGAEEKPVDLWSLDVEGHEMTVLQGGVRFEQIRMILMENFWLSTRNSDYFLAQAGYVKWAQLAIDGLFVRRESDTWYPPNWDHDWEQNHGYRIKPEVYAALNPCQ